MLSFPHYGAFTVSDEDEKNKHVDKREGGQGGEMGEINR